MRNRSLVTLIAAAMIGIAGPALAADSGQAKAKGKSTLHSNKGGAEKGLTRADQSAGSHGDKGRDKAEIKGKRK